MARPEKYPAVHKQMGELMLLARRRGLTFDEWWDEAVRPRRSQRLVTSATLAENRPACAVMWPADTKDRQLVRAATLDSREGWQRAYDREPASRAERALLQLSGLIDRWADPEPLALTG